MDVEFLLYKEELLDALIYGKGIQHIINIGFKLLGNPIVFNDTSSKIIANSSYDKPVGHYWDEHMKKGYFSNDAMYTAKFKKISEKVDRSSSPIMLKGMDDNNMITGKVIIDNIVIGYMIVTDAERPFKDTDIELVSLLCNVIETVMKNDKFYKYTKGTAYESFFKDLLENSIKDNELIMDKMRSLNLDLNSEVYILTFDVKQYSNKKLPLTYLRHKISEIITQNKSLVYNDYIVLLINNRTKVDILGSQYEVMRKFLKKNNLYAGLSQSIKDFTNLQYYYKQSLKSIELGMSLNINKAVYPYEDYVIYDLLNSHSTYESLEKFCNPAIYSLIQYDIKNNTCLTKSLYVYLKNNKNQSVSANILHIHRASMCYRIDKIEKIMKLKLDDANTVHHLYLSLHILELMHKDEFVFEVNKQ
jgi:Regulator of polyketide synthase expression